MLKKFISRKLIITSLALFTLLLIKIMPNSNIEEYKIKKSSLEYVYTNASEVIYLLDSNDYIARTQIEGCNCDTKEQAKDLIVGLTIDESKSNNIKNGFRPILPSGTEVLELELKDKTLTINFSKELLDINEQYEEKMIESIVYTLTSIEGIDNLIIKVEGTQLKTLPKSNKQLPDIFNKNYGINKTYSLTSTNNIDSYTVYYVSNYNNYEYYVPVTKYVNNNVNDKVKIIIDELSSSPIHEQNLMSYLNSNTSLIDYTEEDNKLRLNFDKSIFNDENAKTILEEVVYTISLSLGDNYNIKEVDFLVNNEEIYKKVLKELE